MVVMTVLTGVSACTVVVVDVDINIVAVVIVILVVVVVVVVAVVQKLLGRVTLSPNPLSP